MDGMDSVMDECGRGAFHGLCSPASDAELCVPGRMRPVGGGLDGRDAVDGGDDGRTAGLGSGVSGGGGAGAEVMG